MIRSISDLARMSPVATLVLAIAVTAMVFGADYQTGYEISFSVFYLGPVVLLAWRLGKRAALLWACLSCVCWFLADQAAGNIYSHPAIPFWNASVRLAFFVVTAVLVAALRASHDHQRVLARTDPLTGLATRRMFEEHLDHDLDWSRRFNVPMTLIYVDLDHFKDVNDQLGHATGDRVLVLAAHAMRDAIRDVDLVARLGGDEFAIVLRQTDQNGAKNVVSKITDRVQQALKDIAPKVTCSIGAVTFAKDPPALVEAVQAADSVMYQAKKSGRNRATFVIYGEPLENPV